MALEDIKAGDVLANPFVAGAAGSLLGIKSMSGATWGERFLHLIIGAVCAGYVGPAVAEWLRMESPSMRSAFAFGVGAFGISIYMAAIEAIKRVQWADILTALMPKRGGE
jgi:LytS/YehU family sensor histidine kinase